MPLSLNNKIYEFNLFYSIFSNLIHIFMLNMVTFKL